MKKEFTKDFISISCGCFNADKVNRHHEKYNHLYSENDTLTLEDIMDTDISLRDKIWFLYHQCELTIEQKYDLSLSFSNIVKPIFEKKYPEVVISEENLTTANNDNDQDAFHAGYSTLNTKTESACFHAIAACVFCDDKKYLNELIDYLKIFIEKN